MARAPRPRRKVVTRWRTADGQECRAGTPGAIPRREESATWYGWVAGRLVALQTTDEGQAWVVLKRLLKEQQQREAGVRGEVGRAETTQVPDYVALYASSLRAKGTSSKQARQVESRLLRLVRLADWRWPGDMTEDGLLWALASLQVDHGLSVRSRNHFRTHALAFSAWLARRLKIPDPLAGAGVALPAETDRRHVRRCPAADELARLFAHLDGGVARVRCGMDGPTRATAYRVALGTGLRADELRSLTRASFDLATDRPSVTVQAAYAKARRTDTLPLPPALADRLRKYFAAGGECWAAFPAWHPGRPLKADLEAAGVPYRTEVGVFDMHSLRVWFITHLASQPGITPKALMALARHRDPSLTLTVYARVRTADLDAAAAALPDH